VTIRNISSVSRQPVWSKRTVVPSPPGRRGQGEGDPGADPLGRPADAVPGQALGLVGLVDAEVPAGDIAAQFDVTFAAVSQHLGVLRKAGLVTVRRDGNRLYRANRQALGRLGQVLEQMWAVQLAELAELAEREERA
jgi:DNA-binding transcriptional ArsR family regulator